MANLDDDKKDDTDVAFIGVVGMFLGAVCVIGMVCFSLGFIVRGCV